MTRPSGAAGLSAALHGIQGPASRLLGVWCICCCPPETPYVLLEAGLILAMSELTLTSPKVADAKVSLSGRKPYESAW